MKFLPVYFCYISIFGMASFEKFSNGVPVWFQKQFETTLIAHLPGGIASSYYGIASLEALTASLFFLSFFRGEFLLQRPVPFFKAALLASCLSFAFLHFGLRLTHDFNGAFQLFCYLLLSFGLLLYVESNTHKPHVSFRAKS